MQQQGYADEQVNEAKAQIADLLTAMNDQIVACYDQFVPMPQPVQYLAQICYASVPGWCCDARCCVPEWYYDNGCFVGPCFNAACCGRLGGAGLQRLLRPRQPFLRALPQRRQHRPTSTAASTVANRHADWLRNHGDWHKTLAHDRLVHRAQTSSPLDADPASRRHAEPCRQPQLGSPQPSCSCRPRRDEPRPHRQPQAGCPQPGSQAAREPSLGRTSRQGRPAGSQGTR